MEMTKWEHIQASIGYTFKNVGLLVQAFTRKSYAEENKGALDNEVLEFYGDKALDFIIMKKMSKHYGGVSENGYTSAEQEGTLTDIKKKLVCKGMLASRIRELKLQQFLRMGWGDVEQRVYHQESVQEDLFEAILGAVALDSEWDVAELTRVVDRMLNPSLYFENGFEDDLDYVQLIQQWCQKKYGVLPQYFIAQGVRDYHLLYSECSGNFQCDLCMPPFAQRFSALGENKAKARVAVAKKAYMYLEKNHLLLSLKDEVGDPDFERAINQLQELYQKKYISEPQYTFAETKDENGNSVWKCTCYLASLNLGISMADSSKKQAKKKAAYHMVWLFLGEEAQNEA